jgi:hypothetical protein
MILFDYNSVEEILEEDCIKQTKRNNYFVISMLILKKHYCILEHLDLIISIFDILNTLECPLS